MNETLNNEETIRRFLLGDLAETERAALEDRFMGDALMFERIEDAENDLVDDYVADRLSAGERAKFENYYLSLPENRAKIVAARALRQNQNARGPEISAAKGARFRHSIQNFIASFRLVPAFATAAVLLFVIGGFWFAFRAHRTSEIALSRTPQPTSEIATPSPVMTPEMNLNSPANSNLSPRVSPAVEPTATTKETTKETPRTTEPKAPSPAPQNVSPRPQTVTLALISGLVRGEGSGANKLILPKNVDRVRLTFALPAKNYRDLEARIETVTGARIWSGKIKLNGESAALALPARIFADEDYLLIASGTDETGARKDFAEFYFNTERRN